MKIKNKKLDLSKFKRESNRINGKRVVSKPVYRLGQALIAPILAALTIWLVVYISFDVMSRIGVNILQASGYKFGDNIDYFISVWVFPMAFICGLIFIGIYKLITFVWTRVYRFYASKLTYGTLEPKEPKPRAKGSTKRENNNRK